MAIIRGNIKSAKEHEGMVWFHISSWSGIGWVSLSKNLFDKVYRKRLLKLLYSKHNRVIERNISRLEHEIKVLNKKAGSEHAVRQKEYQIHSLREKLKKELHLHDLEGKKIYLRLI